MFASMKKAWDGVVSSVLSIGRPRTQGLPAGFVLPRKNPRHSNISPRSTDSQSAGRNSLTQGKSVRFRIPASQAGGDKSSANFVVVTPLDSPRQRKRGKLKRRKRKVAPAVVHDASVRSLASPATSGKRRLPKAFLPGLLAAKRTVGSGSDSEDSGSEGGSGSDRRSRRNRRLRSRDSSSPRDLTRFQRMRKLKPTASAPQLTVPGLWDSDSDSGSDPGRSSGRSSPTPGRRHKTRTTAGSGRRNRTVPRSRSALSLPTGGIGSGSEDEAGGLMAMTQSLRMKRAAKLGSRAGTPTTGKRRTRTANKPRRSRATSYLPHSMT